MKAANSPKVQLGGAGPSRRRPRPVAVLLAPAGCAAGGRYSYNRPDPGPS